MLLLIAMIGMHHDCFSLKITVDLLLSQLSVVAGATAGTCAIYSVRNVRGILVNILKYILKDNVKFMLVVRSNV